MKKTKNACTVGDRVEDNNTKSHGIVIDLDIITNEGGEEPRANVHWTKDNSIDNIMEDGWICEGNLTMLHDDENLLHRNN